MQHLLRLGAALVRAQEEFICPFNCPYFTGLDFISLAGNVYGAKLVFYKQGE